MVDAASDGLAAVALADLARAAAGLLYWIEGYPGFPARVSELAERAAVQAGTLAAQERSCWPRGL